MAETLVETSASAAQRQEDSTQQASPSDPSPSTKDNNPNCIFCKICCKEAQAEVVYEDSDYVCFVDRKPVSKHHYLVVPRQHIQDSRALNSSHTPLVERMTEIGYKVLGERGGNVEDARLGFHWPPFIFVRHLHLHVISPEGDMGWVNRNIVFRKDSYVFSSPAYLLNYLKTKP